MQDYTKVKNNNTQQEIPQVNIDNILNKFRYKSIDKFNNDLSIREKEIMESLGIADPSQLKQNTTFTVDGATAILPGDMF